MMHNSKRHVNDCFSTPSRVDEIHHRYYTSQGESDWPVGSHLLGFAKFLRMEKIYGYALLMDKAPIPPVDAIRFSETSASVLLDAIRAIAAVLVLLGHWRNAFFVDYAQIHNYRLLWGVPYLLCAAGHQAVVIFFVLSGFLISGSIIRALQLRKWNWTQYLTHRLVRLWTVLIPALILGGFWDRLGIYLGFAPALYSGADYNHMTPDVGQALSFGDLIGNLGFLQTILVPAYGSNGALWSLANEFWYYLLFPLAACMFAYVYRKAIAKKLLIATLFSLITVFLPKNILLMFPVWLLGTLLYVVPKKSTSSSVRHAVSLTYAVLFFGIAALDHSGWIREGVVSDWTLGIGTFGFLWVLMGAVQRAKPTVAGTISRATAKLSYTLYVAHTPILVFLVSLMARDTRWIPTMHSVSLALGVLAGVATYVWVLGNLTELRTDQLREWIESRILMRDRSDQ